METIRVASGTATGPTAMSSFDAALAAVDCHNYNLRTLSSVIPADASLERVETVPDLGPAGQGLPVVLSRQTVRPGADAPAVAALGWVRSESGRGLFYETSGTDAEAVREAVLTGLRHGMGLREWRFEADPQVVVASEPSAPDEHATAVALATYGQSGSLLGQEP
jgi:arginine decarboxylase